jgi:ABC-2 type transport system permease protein
MKKAFFIMLREVRDFLQDTGDLSFSLLLPILTFALIYGAFSGNLQFNGTAYVVNEDAGGQYSTVLLQKLEANKGLHVSLLSASDADSKLSRSAILMAVIIPSDFSAKLAAGQPTELVFKERGNGGTEGQIVASLVEGAAADIARPVQIQNQVSTTLGGNVSPTLVATIVQQSLAQEQTAPAVSVTETLEGATPDPVSQFLPGIMTMYVLFAVNLTAQALVEERRRGTLERLMTTGLRIRELFFGKFLAYVARGLIQTAVLLLLAEVVFRLFTTVTFLESLALALIFAAACSAIGLTIGSISRTQGQATWISVFFTMLMVMLSGTFISIQQGTLLGTLSHFSINTYANNAFSAVISKGGSLAPAMSDILIMSGVAAAFLVIAGLVFHSSQESKGK